MRSRSLVPGLVVAAALTLSLPSAALADDTTPPVGTLTLYAGDPAANVTNISIDTFATDDASVVTTVELSNNGASWAAFAYPGPGGWDLADASTGGNAAPGTHTVYARWTDAAGNTSVPISKSIIYDPDAPAATVVINDGSVGTNNPAVTIHTTASDLTGIQSMSVTQTGAVSKSSDLAYAPTLAWDLGPGASDGVYSLTVNLRDLAGNQTIVEAQVYLDREAPDLVRMTGPEAADGGRLRFAFSAADILDITRARFSSDGDTWGSPQPISLNVATWDPLDPNEGGTATLGPRTVYAQVSDAAGNWSNTRSLPIFVAGHLDIGVSSSPTTGQPLTLSLEWGATVSLPSGAMCLWEFMWGDDASIYEVQRNETFGYVMTQGPASAGFCDRWTFTLPWTPVRQYLVAVRVMTSDWQDVGSASLGGSPGDVAFTSSVGSTSRHITSSNLPMFYVLPDAYELTLGEPAVYRGYAVGGATIRSTDVWSIQYENVPEQHPGSAVLTFRPKVTGYITVCLSREYAASRQMHACFDPPVERASGGGGGAGTPAPGAATTAPSDGLATVEPSGPPTSTPRATAGDVAVGGPTPVATIEPSMPTVMERERTPLGWLVVALILAAAAAGIALLHPGIRRRALRIRDRLLDRRR